MLNLPMLQLTFIPGDVDSTASAIHTALTLSPETRAQNWTKLFAVSDYDLASADGSMSPSMFLGIGRHH
jgi:hypothetical protein